LVVCALGFVTIAVAACVYRPVSAACSDHALAAPAGSLADAPVAARPEVDSAAAARVHSAVAAAPGPNAAAADDSCRAGFAEEDSAADDSFPAAVAGDCSGSDIRCALAEVQDESYPDDSAALRVAVRCAAVRPADCSEAAGWVEDDKRDWAEWAAVGWAAVCCSAG